MHPAIIVTVRSLIVDVAGADTTFHRTYFYLEIGHRYHVKPIKTSTGLLRLHSQKLGLLCQYPWTLAINVQYSRVTDSLSFVVSR